MDEVQLDLNSPLDLYEKLDENFFSQEKPLDLVFPPKPNALSHFTKSSISSCKREVAGHYILSLCDLQKRLEEVSEIQTSQFEEETNEDFLQIEKRSNEKIENLHKIQEEQKSVNTWNLITNISQYLISGTSIALGIACMPTSGGAGMLLVASGVSGLANRVLHDTGGYEKIASCFHDEENLRKNLAGRIETGIYFLSFALGLAGGFSAYTSGAFEAAKAATNGKSIMKVVSTAIGTASGVLGAVSRFGAAFHERRIAHLQAENIEAEGEENAIYQDLSTRTIDVGNLTELNIYACDTLKGAIANSNLGPLD